MREKRRVLTFFLSVFLGLSSILTVAAEMPEGSYAEYQQDEQETEGAEAEGAKNEGEEQEIPEEEQEEVKETEQDLPEGGPDLEDEETQEEVAAERSNIKRSGMEEINNNGIYLDGLLAGDGIGAAGTAEDPVKTFEQAKELLGDAGGVVFVIGQIKVDTSVTWNGSDKIIIQRHAQCSGNMIEVTNSGELRLEKLTIDGNGETVTADGSLIRVDGGSLTAGDGTIIRNNHVNSASGGGIYAEGAQIRIEAGATISDNRASGGHGGGVALYNSTMQMTGGRISENIAAGGGGIYIEGGGELQISGGEISTNQAEGSGVGSFGGGIMAVNGVKAVITGAETSVSGNTAGYSGGGIYSEGKSNIRVSDGAVVSGNTAVYGGGMFVTDSDSNNRLVVADGASVIQNIGRGRGGGIYFSGSAQVVIDEAEINYNYANYGGGAYGAGVINFEGVTMVRGNTAAASGGGLYLISEITESYGGTVGIHKDLTVYRNTAGNNGGGLYLGTGCTVDIYPTADINVSGNKARNGGGMYAGYNIYYTRDENGNPITGIIDVNNNLADNNGGGIYKTGNMQLGDGYIRANVAGHNGGGIYMASDDGYLIIEGTYEDNPADDIPTTAVVGGNSAGNEGGGIYIPDISNLHLSRVGFLRNTASTGYVCPDPEKNHPEEWLIYQAQVKDREEIEKTGINGYWYASSIGTWIYNDFDVYYQEKCEEVELTHSILVQWITEEEDGSQSVAYAYNAYGEHDAEVTLAHDDIYDDFINYLGEVFDGVSPDTFLAADGYRFSAAESSASGQIYTFGKATVVKFVYLTESKSLPPVCNAVSVGDTAVTGTGVPGATVTITSSRGETVTAIVGEDGKWSGSVTNSFERDTLIQVSQKESGKKESDTIYMTVRAVTRLPDGISLTDIRMYQFGEAELAEQEGDADLYTTNSFQDYRKGLDIRYDLMISGTFDWNEQYEIVLPQGVKSVADNSFAVNGDNGQLLFTVILTAGSDIVGIEFSQYAGEELGYGTAYFYFGALFDRDELDKGANEIVFELGAGKEGEVITIVVEDPEPQVIKNGEFIGYDSDLDSYILEWKIQVNPEQVPVSEMVLLDELMEGHVLIPDSVRITSEDGNDASDQWDADFDVNSEASSLKWIYNGGEQISEEFIFTFKTRITELTAFAYANSKDYNYSVPNTVVLNFQLPSGDHGQAEDTTNLLFSTRIISKNATRIGQTNQFRWYITMNPYEYVLNDVVVTDVLDLNSDFGFWYYSVEGGRNVIRYYAGDGILPEEYGTSGIVNSASEVSDYLSKFSIYYGDQINYTEASNPDTGAVWREGREYSLEFTTDSDTGAPVLRISFHVPVSEKMMIRLYSFYTAEDVYDTKKKLETENYARIDWEDDSWGIGKEDREIGIGTQFTNTFISKSGEYDAYTQTFTWTAAVNLPKVKLTEAVVRDLIRTGQELIGDEADNWGVQIYKDRTLVNGAYRYSDDDLYDPALYSVSRKDISKADIQTMWGIQEETDREYLDIKFKEPVDRILYIQFKTKLTDYNILCSRRSQNFVNDVFLYADQFDGYLHTYASVPVTGRIIDKVNNGFITATNQPIWAVVVNQHYVDLGGAGDSFVITDKIDADQKFAEGTLEVVWEDREGNFGPLDKTMYEWKYQPGEPSGGTITVTIPEPGERKYVIYLNTEVYDLSVFENDKAVTFRNEVTFRSTKTAEEITADAVCVVKKTVLDKAGGYQEGNDYIDWSVTIDATLTNIDLSGVTLIDKLADGLELAESSVLLTQYKYVEGEDGETELDPVDILAVGVTYDRNENAYVFSLPDEIPNGYIYKLTFTTNVLQSGIYSNQITMTGDKSYEAGSEDIDVTINTIGGGGKTRAFKLMIDKEDEQGGKLSGAKFLVERVGSEKNTAIGGGSTDTNGYLELPELKYNIEYVLKELEPPEGFQPLEEEIPILITYDGEGEPVVVQPQNASLYYEYHWDPEAYSMKVTVINEAEEKEKPETGSIILYKVDAENRNMRLEGAEFILYRQEDGEKHYYTIAEELVDWSMERDSAHRFITDENGEIYLEGLELDAEYIFEEVKPPEGYLLTEDKTPFRLDIENSAQTLVIENQKEKDQPEPPGQPDPPKPAKPLKQTKVQAGDDTEYMRNILLCVLSAGIITGIIIYRKKRAGLKR